MRSSSCFGRAAGNGDAMWSTYVASLTASAHPSSLRRLVSTTSKDEIWDSVIPPAACREDFIAAARDRVRTVVRTRYP